MRSATGRTEAAIILALLLTACVGGGKPPARADQANPVVKIGKPYQVFGVWYYPSDDRQYDQRGIASWYGPGFHAMDTANGERYDQDDITAAHKTLPMPSYVEVENLMNGRKLTVRVNDRGPFVDGRIIDLSRRSAQLLGVDRAGTAKVRVRRVFPDAETIAQLAQFPKSTTLNRALTEAPALPKASLSIQDASIFPSASVALQHVTTTKIHWVQVAALLDAGRISWLRNYLSAFGAVVTETTTSGLTRVRLGPYPDSGTANAVLAQLRNAGYNDAQIILIPTKP
jgi:rare lipoprotein A